MRERKEGVGEGERRFIEGGIRGVRRGGDENRKRGGGN